LARISLVLLSLGAVLALIVVTGFAAYRLAKRAKWQVSLRGLFGLVTAIAVVLAVFYGYRRSVMAQVRWIAPGSKQAESLFPVGNVSQNSRGEYEFSYYARRRRIQSLLPQMTQGRYAVDREGIRVSSRDRTAADEHLKRLRDADVLPPGTFVIRGRVIDKESKPLGGATVDLMGPYVFINHFQTRDDGTFTMPLSDGRSKAPAGHGYYLRIRAREETA